MGQKLTVFASKLGVPFSAGAVAGTVATAPMTLFMLLLQRMLPHQRHRTIYLVGPFAGALLAVGIAWLLRGRTTPQAVKAAKGD